MSASLKLGEMVDLALGSPEVGAVNFNVLHTLLHAMVQHLDLGNIKAEIDEADKELLLKARSNQNLANASTTDEEKIKDEEGKGSTPLIPKRSVYHVLEDKVSRLENQIDALNSLPSNEELMERSRSLEKTTPVSDMWQQMQLQKRVDANEEGIAKLMSMVDDMLAEVNSLKNEAVDWKQNIKDLNEKMEQLSSQNIDKRLSKLESSTPNKDKLDELQRLINELNEKVENVASADMLDGFVTWPGLEDALKGIRQDPIMVSNQVTQTTQFTGSKHHIDSTDTPQFTGSKHHIDSTDTPQFTGSKHHIDSTDIPLSTDTQLSDSGFSSVPNVSAATSPIPSRPSSSRPGSRMGPSEEIQKILSELGELCGKYDNVDGRVTVLEENMPNKVDRSEMDELLANQQIPDDLAAQLKRLKEGLDTLNKNKDKDSESINNFRSALMQLQDDLEKLSNTCTQLVDEANAKQKHIDALYTFIDRLQEIKADKEHVTMEIDVKADKRALENKISQHQFDGAVGKLNQNVSDLLLRLGGHQEAFDKAMHQIELDIDTKLDRMELDPLKEYLERRIKAASAKMIKIQAVNDDEEVAGFRKPLQHKVHCISCDRPVELVTHGPVPSLPESKPLPGTRSGRPYTTFELEQIRASQKSQNMTDTEYYVTSRACGGSHTMTYPHRRITRMTHLNQLFQDEEPPTPIVSGRMLETELQGADGHIYKGRGETDDDSKLPALPGQSVKSVSRTTKSTHPMSGRSRRLITPAPSSNMPEHQDIHRPSSAGRPMSARPASRPTSGRPSSARPASQGSPRTSPQDVIGPRPATPSGVAVEVPQAVPESTQLQAEEIRQSSPKPDEN
uniref:DUF4795 domain-containing protein n=1 Tax=Saccoglossus kowalevskii TaxID=10224 RepID=A0ABM0MGQ6_SACKO|nr:PREDICTED: putative uncharacterized protein C16orf96-like [Saccoglossus kowalevskii]